MLVQRPFRPIGLRALFNGALVMAGDLSRSAPMSFSLFLGNVESHPESLLMLAFVRLTKNQSLHSPYLKPIQLELQLLLLIEQLLKSISEDDVRVVQSAVLLVELIVLIATSAQISQLIMRLLNPFSPSV